MKSLTPLPFPGKIWLLFAVFGIFFPENRARSKVKEVGSKFDKYYFIHTIPGQLPVKNFGSNVFQFCDYLSQRKFLKNFNPDWQTWLVFLTPFLYLLRTYIEEADAEFNVESIGTNFKSQKWKIKKLVCLFLIALFKFKISLTI